MRLVGIDVIHRSKCTVYGEKVKMNRVPPQYTCMLVFLFGLSACLFVCLVLALPLPLYIMHVHLSTRFSQMLAHEVLFWKLYDGQNFLKWNRSGAQSLASETKWQHNFHISFFTFNFDLSLLRRRPLLTFYFMLPFIRLDFSSYVVLSFHLNCYSSLLVAPQISWRWFISSSLLCVWICFHVLLLLMLLMM